jgi:hypothetical protein
MASDKEKKELIKAVAAAQRKERLSLPGCLAGKVFRDKSGYNRHKKHKRTDDFGPFSFVGKAAAFFLFLVLVWYLCAVVPSLVGGAGRHL